MSLNIEVAKLIKVYLNTISELIMDDLSEKKINGLTIKIDKETCIGTSNCIKVASEVFEFDDEKICSFKKDLPDIEQQRLTEACSVCPVNALHAIDESGKQIAP